MNDLNQTPSPTPPPLPSSPRRRRGRRWPWAVALFVLLCLLAALGNYLFHRAALRGTGFSAILSAPTILAPTTWPPRPTPHVLPDTISGVIQTLQPVLKERFGAACAEKNIQWPPARTRLVGLKSEKQLELWVANLEGPFHLLKTYPILAASGGLGPKRRQGDRQVPEGHYELTYLNPESTFHLSMLLDYPNAADKLREASGVADGADLGGDICIHGSNLSIGCLAIGDAAIEEVFTIVAMADAEHRDVLILPADFRKRPDMISLAGDDADVLKLYRELSKLSETVKD